MQTYISRTDLINYSEQNLLAEFHSLQQLLAVTDPNSSEYSQIVGAMQNIKRAIFAKRRFGLR